MPQFNLLSVERGAVVAPAGCGKTQLLADSLATYNGKKPLLILTHTNAGVAALRTRFNARSIPRTHYRLMTIDGWCLRTTACFPLRSGVPVSSASYPKPDYAAVRHGMLNLITGGHIDDVLRASYERCWVDEYQDTSNVQHGIIVSLSKLMPTAVLADPMQAIFDWDKNDPLPDWNGNVLKMFPLVHHLDTPHRWINAGAEPLGRWLLGLRGVLEAGTGVDLRAAPSEIQWLQLTGNSAADFELKRKAALTKPVTAKGSVIILEKGIDKSAQYAIALTTPGAIMIENVDLTDLQTFCQRFSPDLPNATELLAHFAGSVMRNTGSAELLKRIAVLERGSARNPANDLEQTILEFRGRPCYRGAAKVLAAFGAQPGVTQWRTSENKAVYGLHRPLALAMLVVGSPDRHC